MTKSHEGLSFPPCKPGSNSGSGVINLDALKPDILDAAQYALHKGDVVVQDALHKGDLAQGPIHKIVEAQQPLDNEGIAAANAPRPPLAGEFPLGPRDDVNQAPIIEAFPMQNRLGGEVIRAPDDVEG